MASRGLSRLQAVVVGIPVQEIGIYNRSIEHEKNGKAKAAKRE